VIKKIDLNKDLRKNGETYLHLACHTINIDKEIIRFMLQNGADPNLVDNFGNLALLNLLKKKL
jgi:ankyrin repeat protein